MRAHHNHILKPHVQQGREDRPSPLFISWTLQIMSTTAQKESIAMF